MTTREPIDPAVAAYVEAIPAEHRELFDRVHRIILETCPDATVVLSYKMPTYRVGERRLLVGVWKHGVSLYGWKHQGDGGFTARHPEARTSTGTIRIHSDTAAAIPDDDFRDLADAVLNAR